MNWRDFWNRDNPIYVNQRHKLLHYRQIARDIAALLPSSEAVVLDYGCGEAQSADIVAARVKLLFLSDAAPLVRGRLQQTFAVHERIRVLSPDEVAALEENSLDLIVVNSLVQYLSQAELEELLALWRNKLKPDGKLIIADIIPPNIGAVTDANALLRFAFKGGFFVPALIGLVRTALSDYRKLRNQLGLSHYTEAGMKTLLEKAGFSCTRLETNLGHNQARMAFSATPQ